MDVTVLENTQGSSLYACHEETEREGQDGGERRATERRLPGKRTGARHH